MKRVRRVDKLWRRFCQCVRARELSDDTVSSPMMEIGEGRFLWCRRQQDRRYPGGAWGAWINFAETLTGAWQRVGGQMWMFLAVVCRSIEYLHDDRSYVLIGGQRWQIRWWQWFWRRGGASGGRDSTLRTSDCGGAVGRWHWKGLLTTEDEVAKNTNKTRLQDTRKLEQWLWYHVRNTEWLYCISQVIEYT